MNPVVNECYQSIFKVKPVYQFTCIPLHCVFPILRRVALNINTSKEMKQTLTETNHRKRRESELILQNPNTQIKQQNHSAASEIT